MSNIGQPMSSPYVRSPQQPRAQQPDEIAAAVATRHLERKQESDRRHVDSKLQRLEKRIEEVASAFAAGGRWAELQGQVDGMAETVQDLVRRFGPPLDDVAAKESPALNSLSERVAELEAWTRSRTAMPEPQPSSSIADALEQMQCKCERQLQDYRKEMVRRFGSMVTVVEVLEERVGSVENDLEGVTELREQLAAVHADASKTMCAMPSAASGLETGRDTSSGGHPSANVQMYEEEEVAGRSENHECRIDELEYITGDMHQQIVHLSSKFVYVERALEDLEQGIREDSMNQGVRHQVDEVGKKLACLREGMRSDSSTPVHSTHWQLQSEINAISDDVWTISTDVRSLKEGLQEMSKAFTRVCEELVSLRRLV